VDKAAEALLEARASEGRVGPIEGKGASETTAAAMPAAASE
jgi:hypothetical protein